jgi:ubiquinone/menaquinone biosynthesis C-methylase UbiE
MFISSLAGTSKLPNQQTVKLTYNSPMPSKSNPTRETYDQFADQIADRFWSVELPEQWEAFSAILPPGAKVLDLGCGAGRDTAHFAGRGFWTVGLDLSRGMLLEAMTRAPGMYLEGNMSRLPFGLDTFDAVWMNASLLHLPRDLAPAVLSGVNQTLKPGGVVYLSLKIGRGEEWETREGERFFTYYQPDEVAALLNQTGFIVTRQWIEEAKKVTWMNVLGNSSSQ